MCKFILMCKASEQVQLSPVPWDVPGRCYRPCPPPPPEPSCQPSERSLGWCHEPTWGSDRPGVKGKYISITRWPGWESKLNMEKQRSVIMPHISWTNSQKTAGLLRLSTLLNRGRSPFCLPLLFSETILRLWTALWLLFFSPVSFKPSLFYLVLILCFLMSSYLFLNVFKWNIF